MLSKFRKKIDKLDNKIFSLLNERFNLMPEIAEIKKKKDLKTTDNKREKEIIKSKIKKYENELIDSKFVKKFYSIVFSHSKKLQKNHLRGLKK